MGRAFEYRRASKERRWGMMSRIFPKLAKAITIATKEGGADYETNSKLRAAIQNAKSKNMPKDNIQQAIKRASGKDTANFVSLNYEGKGPFGVLIFVECATDNTTRTIANIKSYFNKAGGILVPSGSLEFLFDYKAVFEIPITPDLDTDYLELELISAGLEDSQKEDDIWYLYADYKQFGVLAEALETRKIEISSASLKRIATNPIHFSKEQLENIEKLLDKLEDDEDVQAVFTNVL